MKDVLGQLRAAVGQILRDAVLPGAAIAAYIDGQLALETSIGDRDLQRTVPLPVDAPFYIYSVTKTLIAAAVLHQANTGRLDLESPIQQYWPDFPVDTPITLRQILSHTSGLPDYGGVADYHEAVKASPGFPWSFQDYLNVARTRELLFDPGTGWSYSNIGYLALKTLLEQITGRSLQDILDALFFTPLGLKQTFVATSLADVVNLTPGYTRALGGNERVNMAQRYHPGWVSHGVVVSTAAELAAMIDALFAGQILDSSLVEQMAQPVYSLGSHPPLQNVGCGLGLFMDTDSPHGQVVGHSGGGPGYSIAAFHFSSLAGCPTTIAAATNQEGDNIAVDVAYAVARALAEA
ncbi:beta-lactamase family protein [Nodosilinea sp. LEGE 06152]|uniref:serine hydrolase n=1 Tax=Nodosilinea sp. LEGE 06152 TaxID=2777966 RepID=UPI0018810A09|nr:beta-lactamase family protein [Nodosilinea sp. LEGE 06152]